jgi:hypothetical protein
MADEGQTQAALLRGLRDALNEHFGIDHVTI